MRLFAAFFVVFILIAESKVDALTHCEDWNSNSSGWNIGSGSGWAMTYQPSGGVNNSGYYDGTRNNYYPIFWPKEPPATTNFTGDLETLYGNNLITISYDVKDFAGNAAHGVWHTIYNADQWWTKQILLTSPGEWTTVATVIDTNWTDAEAYAHGWTLLGGSGSWTDLLDNATEQWAYHSGTNGYVSGAVHTGVDNFTMMSGGTLPPLPPVQIGGYRQLFVDDVMIAAKSNVNLTLHQPTKHTVGGKTAAVILSEEPWEGNVSVYGTAIYDEQDKLYKMWYRAFSDTGYVCYATSTDGINWTKPNLGLAAYKGSTNNNICGGFGSFYTDAFGVIKDVNDSDPSRRYKMLIYHGSDSFAAMVSPDGVNWSGPVNALEHQSGDVLSLYYDEGLDKYVGLTKRYVDGKRSRLITYSDDFVNWTSPQIIMTPDGLDSSTTHFYSHVGYEYEGMRIGYVAVYDTATQHIDSQLVYSRDGLNWQRYRDRIPFIPYGEAGDFDSGMVIAGCGGLVANDEKIYIYYGGENTIHGGIVIGGGEAISGVGLAELRKDGFVSADAGAAGGTLTTVPFILPERQLTINAVATASGGIRAELLDAAGEVIDGYGLADSSEFSGDSLGAQLLWNGETIGESLIGEAVSLRFYIEDASLYSFWFTADLMPGDADGNGQVDAADLATLAGNWQATGIGWAEGDFNNDGIVDDFDATLLSANWLSGVPPDASVPEPSLWILLLSLSAFVIMRNHCHNL